ncbi:hypothetical protein [Haloarcula litorea]|uniref:hypothetical protein n=1 Tax=Haloarcula litorea TaxID=3032579 RepID=UPI0023E8DCD9|nr:hypothetical protein [Halomicroarcula sp. GDY20]
MTRRSLQTVARPGPQTDDAALGPALAAPLLLGALLAAATAPVLAAVAAVTVVLATKAAQLGLGALARRAGDRFGRVELPGVATVSVHISPR